jgi:hypothetical protein
MPDSKRIIGHPGDRFVVPVGPLADEIMKHMPEMDALAGEVHNQSRIINKGGRQYMARRASTMYVGTGGKTISDDHILRKLNDILNKRLCTVRVELADALLLACNVNIEDTDVPTIPAGLVAAADMVDSFADTKGMTLSATERTDLMTSCLDFAKGCALDPYNTDLKAAPIPVTR